MFVRAIWLALAAIGLAQAVAAGELVVAHVGPFTGPLAGNGLANHEGARACAREANATGGMNGNRLKLVREDDHYTPEDTVQLLREVAHS